MTMDHSLFDTFRLTNVERGLGVYGVHVHVEGKGELEHRFRADDRVHLWSASKTFTSVGVGIAIDEGRFALDDAVLGFFPQFADAAAPGSEAITVRHLLQMSCGKEYDMFSVGDSAVFGGGSGRPESADWAQLFFAGEVTTNPGTHFFYANAATYMLGRVVEAASGQVLREYLLPRLFGPLGVYNPWWNTCPDGHSLGAFGLQLRTSEFAKLGRLLLQDGCWDDRELVSAGYVYAMHTDVVVPAIPGGDKESSVGYGYQVWLNTTPGTYRADGMYGQYSIVLPEQRAVVTVTAHNERNGCDIIRAVFADLVPRL